ncbi:hypothetical protein HYPSUDRAFT_38470 [Hypholoma sublateritium FD-334 SS-4]|uniref:Uncharacterized protein n=1 Tax=Hypholoma sublateritium (strain FD-334 SS-4) TaxID=945553 RepID=A0A0D2P1L8_HYPSF|nr:hypothetical protein HYPSUDRAFT_38470 [Hypholoma sublateritium FD-334 SS-4]
MRPAAGKQNTSARLPEASTKGDTQNLRAGLGAESPGMRLEGCTRIYCARASVEAEGYRGMSKQSHHYAPETSTTYMRYVCSAHGTHRESGAHDGRLADKRGMRREISAVLFRSRAQLMKGRPASKKRPNARHNQCRAVTDRLYRSAKDEDSSMGISRLHTSVANPCTGFRTHKRVICFAAIWVGGREGELTARRKGRRKTPDLAAHGPPLQRALSRAHSCSPETAYPPRDTSRHPRAWVGFRDQRAQRDFYISTGALYYPGPCPALSSYAGRSLSACEN